MSCPSVLVVHVLEIEYGRLPVKVAVFVMALSIRDGLVSGPLGFGPSESVTPPCRRFQARQAARMPWLHR
jgi:hypothetical protein